MTRSAGRIRAAETAAGKRRRGFTLIEILVVVAILAIMVSAAAVSIASGSAAAKVNAGVRGVVQLTRYARTMALLKQRPAWVEFSSDGRVKITLEASNDGISESEAADIGEPAEPVARPAGDGTAAGQQAFRIRQGRPAESKDGGGESMEGEDGGGGKDDDSDDVVERKLDGVSLEVTILDEAGNPMSDEDIVENMKTVRIGESAPEAGEGASDPDAPPARTVAILYETTGRCPAFRVTVRREGDEESEGRTVAVDRFGRVRTQEDDGR